MTPQYRIVIRGKLPDDIKQRISAIHAAAILATKDPDGSDQAEQPNQTAKH